MKAIIKNGVANKDIQSCLISECGVEITFHNTDKLILLVDGVV